MINVIEMVRYLNPQLLNSNDKPLGYRGFLEILVRIALKIQSRQANIQCWAIIGPPVGRKWLAFSGIWILTPLINLTKKSQS